MAKTKPEYMKARRGFILAAAKGQNRGRVVKGGEVLAADDPAVKAHPDFFDPLEEVIEDAAAWPGGTRPITPGARSGRAAKAKAKSSEASEAADA